MKILVTVGTTVFDTMIRKIDSFAESDPTNEYVFQVGSGAYCPRNGVSFDFTDKINEYYLSADLIITHAGAGTIYKLLELQKKILVIPNFERIDKHQADIALFMEKYNHLLVAWDLEEVNIKMGSYSQFVPVPFIKEKFFKYQEISDFIEN